MKRILVAPLNWGLGHVTRCIPLIRSLERRGMTVYLASDGRALDLLRLEFPHLPAFRLPSYRIRYRYRNMVRNMAWQMPRIIWAVRAEQLATERFVKRHGIRGIISDNRYGCFSARADSVLLTHQLHIRVPAQALEWMVNGILRLALAKFNRIWVPDAGGNPNLSGSLSHGEPVHNHIHYTGILTRMQHYPQEREYDVAVVLSGPEPQRSILEERLLEQAINLPERFIFIQGKTQARKHYYAADHVEVVSYLTSAELNRVLLASEALICRSGFSSIMDLAALGKKALLIPTPGQTEQEYLADLFARQNVFGKQEQDKINLAEGLAGLKSVSGIEPGQFDAAAFEPILEGWLDGL